MIGPRVGIKVGMRVGLAVGVGKDPVASNARILVGINGQSNVFSGVTSELSSGNAFYANPFSNVQMAAKLDGNTDPPSWTEVFKQALAPVTYAGSPSFGPELSMMRDLESGAPGQWAKAAFAGAGTNLYTQWLPTGTYPALDGTGKNLFQQCVAYYQAKEAELAARLGVMCWIQGEGDAGALSAANAYQTNLLALVDAFRAVWPNLPFVIGRLNSDYVNATGGVGTYTSTVQAAQDAVALARTGIYIINPDGVPLRADHTHYPGDSHITLGHSYAGKVANALGVAIPPIASFTSSPSALVVSFTDTTIAPGSSVAAWSWNFGDGGTSTSQNPSHTYAGAGSYNVSLTVTAANGKTNKYTTSVTVSAVAWTVDPTANQAFPATTTEWNSFITAKGLTNWSAPNGRLGLDQDAASPLADVLGNFNLPLIGAGANYQQAVTGYTRKAATLTDGTSGGFKTTSASLPDTSTTSVLALVKLHIPSSAPGAQRFLVVVGTNLAIILTTASKLNIGSGSNTGTGTVSQAGKTVFAILRHDKTNGIDRLYIPDEKIVVTQGAITGKVLNLGSGGAAASVGYLYDAMWTGASAERSDADCKAMLQALGETVPWT